MEYPYECKKNGRTYLYTSAATLPTAQDVFAWQYGVHTYADRYHADVTLNGAKAWKGTRAEYDAKIDSLCVEARDRFHIGDIPGQRASADPKVRESRALAAKIVGVDPAVRAQIDAILAAAAAGKTELSPQTAELLGPDKKRKTA